MYIAAIIESRRDGEVFWHTMNFVDEEMMHHWAYNVMCHGYSFKVHSYTWCEGALTVAEDDDGDDSQ